MNIHRQIIEYLFITDGSTDGTNEIVNRFPQIRLIFHPERKGKSPALNRVTEFASNHILVFSDANALLNRDALLNITRHYADKTTGGVAGEKRVLSSGKKDDLMNSEGLYWKYESALKKIDSDFYSIVGAAGELFSVRKDLWSNVEENTILDDFVISMQVAQMGYRIRYEPDAYAMELPSANLDEERKRKIRIATGGFQAMKKFRGLYRFWKHPRLSFLYISHRVLRWAVSPICLILMFVINAILAIAYDSTFYEWLFVLQSSFYFLAFLGFLANKNKRQIPLLSTCYYFTFMNLSSIAGFVRYKKNEKRLSGIWEKAKRQTETI